MSSGIDINKLLQNAQDDDIHFDDPEETGLSFELVYQELRKIAHNQLRKSWSIQTMQTTALINETYLKLHSHEPLGCASRLHFFALCAKAMRQIVVNYAEQKSAQKRGGDLHRVTFEEVAYGSELDDSYRVDTLLAVDQALVQLAEIDQHLCKVVELRFFAGMNESEVAQLFGVTERTVRRDWVKAKALLSQALSSD